MAIDRIEQARALTHDRQCLKGSVDPLLKLDEIPWRGPPIG
jgi:hypothetical protein